MKRLVSLITMYLPSTPYVLVYMLQQVEYDPGQFMEWGSRWPDFRRVIKRKKLVHTAKARALVVLAYIAYFAGLSLVAALVLDRQFMAAVASVFAIPGITLLVLLSAVLLGQPFLQAARAKQIKTAADKMAEYKGIKIAVLGSYGKTTAKEVLATVLGEGLKLAYTPGNMNVEISHARWINSKVKGTEDILILEYGEYRPGDIRTLADLTYPDYAVLAGYAPNHLDTYKSADALKEDLKSIEDFVKPDNLFVSEQAKGSLGFGAKDAEVYSSKSVLGWKISSIETSLDGTSFSMSKGNKRLSLKSGLLGEHLVPLLALAVALGLRLGLKDKQLIEGVSKTKPFEHRLEPRHLHGAWIIDDTYNGNIEGMRAGLELLKSLPAKRRIYVTPGLVEQGSETEAVHEELGQLIAAARPDVVVLMQNSVAGIIRTAMEKVGFKGKITIEHEPLKYYEHLQYQLAAGDVALLQNDWTDNYN